MELTEIFRIIIPPLVIVGFIAWHFILPNWSLQRINKQILRKSTDELKAICVGKQSDLLIGLALNELKTRGEDLSFALPKLLDMAIHWHPAKRVLGRAWLSHHLKDKLPHIDLSGTRLSRESRQKLEELREQIRNL